MDSSPFGLPCNLPNSLVMESTMSMEHKSTTAAANNTASISSPNIASLSKPIWGNCLVCNDKGTGKHYGIVSCEGCKGFFKRSVRKNLAYSCRGSGLCPIDRVHRNRCQKCRLSKCLEMGMKREAVQCERKPLTRDMSDPDLAATCAAASSFSTPLPAPAPIDNRNDSAYSSDSETYPRNNSNSPAFLNGSSEHFTELLVPEHMEFKLNTPTLGVSSISMEYIYELATRLLFVSVDWIRSIPVFRGLDPSDQLVLLQNMWSDLFMLGVSQCSQCFPLSPLLTLAASQLKEQVQDRKPPSYVREISLFERVVNIKDLVFSFERLELGKVEYAYLKTIVVFNSDCQSLKNPRMVEVLQEKAHCSLKKYVERTCPQNPERFAKILLRLPATKNLSPESIEQIFFAPLIGTVRIENIMANIMNSSISF